VVEGIVVNANRTVRFFEPRAEHGAWVRKGTFVERMVGV